MHIKKYFNKFSNTYNLYVIFSNSILYFLVCCIIDYFNIIGKFMPLSIIIIFSIIVFVFISFIKNKTYKEIKNNAINNIDLYLINLLILIPLILIDILTITIIKRKIYYIILIILIAITLLTLIYRIKKCNIIVADNQTLKKNYNLYDLYKNKIKKGEYVILDDIEVRQKEYDLIGYNEFVDNLSENLIHNTPKERFAIGLIGKWGTGKTSIINLMKEKSKTNELKIIEFKPWIYEDYRELFKGLYNKIFEGLEEKNEFEINSILKQFEKIIFGAIEKKYGFNFIELNNPEKLNDIEKIKQIVNERIGRSSERIVIVIDDIDRLEKEEIIFIFKVINQIFDFKNIIYILCYDEERVHNMFKEELNIDKEYFEKIIQSKVYIPMIDKDIVNNILNESLHNLININDIRINDLNLFYIVTKKISETIKNIREVISFLNCISQEIEFVKKFELDIIDFVIIQYIKIYDYKLYEIIYRNKISFITPELYLKDEQFVKLNNYSEELAEKIKQIESNKPLQDLLNIIFSNSIDNYTGYSPIFIERKNTFNSHYCKNNMYFERYFFTNKYSYMDIETRVNNFIEKLNNTGYKKDALYSLIKKTPKGKQSYIFKLLTNAKGLVKNKEYIIDNIIKNLLSLESISDTNSCIYEMIFNYFTYMSEKKIKKYAKELIEKDRMFTIRLLNYSKQVTTSAIYNEQIIVDILNQSIKEDIGLLYSKKVDFFSLANSYKIENIEYYLEKNELYDYFEKITNEKNIFKIAYKLLYRNNNNKFSINNYNIEKYYREVNGFIKKVINTKPITKDQRIIQEIYSQESSTRLKHDINEKNL